MMQSEAFKEFHSMDTDTHGLQLFEVKKIGLEFFLARFYDKMRKSLKIRDEIQAVTIKYVIMDLGIQILFIPLFCY